MSDQPVTKLPIDHLQPNPLQPRGVITPTSLSELVDSIKNHGVLQPLTVAQTPAGYQIIAGERRWRASKLVGLTEVPVHLIKTTPQGMLEMAIVENVQRTDLNPIDRANSFERLMTEFNLTNSAIATRVSKSPAFVSNSLRLLDLPDALKDGLISGVVTEGHARALAAIDDNRAMIEAYKTILREGGSVRRAEELARRYKNKLKQKTQKDTTPAKILNELVDEMAKNIQTSIGKNAKVKMRRSRVETAIHIVLKGNPEDTEKQLQNIYDAITLPIPVPEINNQPEKKTKEEKETKEEKTPTPTATKEEEVAPETTTSSPYSNPFEPIQPETKVEEFEDEIDKIKDLEKEDEFEDY